MLTIIYILFRKIQIITAKNPCFWFKKGVYFQGNLIKLPLMLIRYFYIDKKVFEY